MRLETRDLAIGYPEHRVAEGINLTANAGEVLCLLGPNGSGKTTLFRTLLGLLKPLGGGITCDGAALAALSRQDIARRIAAPSPPRRHAIMNPRWRRSPHWGWPLSQGANTPAFPAGSGRWC